MSVNNLDYEDDKFDPNESVKADKTEDELTKAEKKRKRKEDLKKFVKDKTEDVKKEAKEQVEKALGFKLEKEEITKKIHNMVDDLSSTALGGICSLIGLPPGFIEALIKQNTEMEAFNARCDEEIAYNESDIEHCSAEMDTLKEYMDDFDRKEGLNAEAEAEQLKLDPSLPKHLIDYPFYLDYNLRLKWEEDWTKCKEIKEQLEAENKELKDKKTNWGKELVERAKNSPIGIKIKEAVSDLKTKATELIKGIQLLIQNIVALFTEGMGAAVVAMGSGVVVSPSPASIMSSMQKIAATAQALGAAISGIMLAAAELGLNGSKNEYIGTMPDLITPLKPFAISLGIVASLA